METRRKEDILITYLKERHAGWKPAGLSFGEFLDVYHKQERPFQRDKEEIGYVQKAWKDSKQNKLMKAYNKRHKQDLKEFKKIIENLKFPLEASTKKAMIETLVKQLRDLAQPLHDALSAEIKKQKSLREEDKLSKEDQELVNKLTSAYCFSLMTGANKELNKKLNKLNLKELKTKKPRSEEHSALELNVSTRNNFFEIIRNIMFEKDLFDAYHDYFQTKNVKSEEKFFNFKEFKANYDVDREEGLQLLSERVDSQNIHSVIYKFNQEGLLKNEDIISRLCAVPFMIKDVEERSKYRETLISSLTRFGIEQSHIDKLLKFHEQSGSVKMEKASKKEDKIKTKKNSLSRSSGTRRLSLTFLKPPVKGDAAVKSDADPIKRKPAPKSKPPMTRNLSFLEESSRNNKVRMTEQSEEKGEKEKAHTPPPSPKGSRS